MQTSETQNSPEFITSKEAAELLRRTEGGLRVQRCRGGGPPYYRSGGRILYRRADVLAWLERVEPAAGGGDG